MNAVSPSHLVTRSVRILMETTTARVELVMWSAQSMRINATVNSYLFDQCKQLLKFFLGLFLLVAVSGNHAFTHMIHMKDRDKIFKGILVSFSKEIYFSGIYRTILKPVVGKHDAP